MPLPTTLFLSGEPDNVLGEGVATSRAAGRQFVMASDNDQHLAMLRILYGACAAALDAFRAADNPVDEQLVIDLEAMVSRTQSEIERLAAHLAKTP